MFKTFLKIKNKLLAFYRRHLFICGAMELSNLVTKTFGAKGKLIANFAGVETITTKDGFNVSGMYKSSNPYKLAGAKLIAQASLKTLQEVGDGTTGTVVIASHFLPLKLSRMEIEEIENEVKDVLKLIDGKAKKIKTVADLKKIAMIASNFDSEIAEAVSQNINLFGVNGSYIIEEGRVPGITAIHKSGFTFDSGYLSNSFVNDKSGAAILKNPALLIARDDYGISDIIETVNACIKNKQSLLIIGNPDDQTLASIVQNHLNGVLQFCAVPPPYFGVKRDNFIADINKINSFPGAIKQVIVRKHSITIEHDTDLTDYIKQILNTDTLSTEEAEHNKMRAARLSGSVVIFKIGANNVGELKERKDRLEDTILSTLSSLKSGYVKGGGYTLYELSSSVSNRHLMKALQKPYLTILKNSEIKPDGKFINVLTGLNNTDDIIDSAAVIKAELKNAISVAKIFMNIADVTV